MKVGIHNSAVDNFAIACTSVGILADALAGKYRTEIVVQEESTRKTIEAACERQLGRVTFRTVENCPDVKTDPSRPDRRYQAVRDWSDELTRPYDLFINFTDRIPIFNSAQRGVLVVQFPHDFVPSPFRALWQEHLATYQLKLANSYYTSFWTRLLWEMDCPVVYPPVLAHVSTPVRDQLILAAASFNSYRDHLKLIEAFVQLRERAREWNLTMIGDLDDRSANGRYFEKVKTAASNSGVSIIVNPTSQQRSELCKRSRVFWQASSLSAEFERIPENVEPLSELVLSAMAAGCVPLVNNAGAASEVIRQAENGFFWDTTEELIQSTLKVVLSETRRLKLSQRARQRALVFSPENYSESFQKQLEAAFGMKHHSLANPVQLWKRLLRSTTQRLTSARTPN